MILAEGKERAAENIANIHKAHAAATGSVCATGSIDDFVAFTRRERVKWGDIVRRSNAKID